MLVAAGDAEEAEDHRHDEHVVHRQRLLDQETGVELQRRLRAQLVPHPGAEQYADAEVARIQQQAFAHFDFPVVAVQHAQVEHQQTDDDGHEHQPQPGAGTEDRCCEECLQSCHEPLLECRRCKATVIRHGGLAAVRGARYHMGLSLDPFPGETEWRAVTFLCLNTV
ncbi:hypothetical protein D9M71_602660 [compost metagenome]